MKLTINSSIKTQCSHIEICKILHNTQWNICKKKKKKKKEKNFLTTFQKQAIFSDYQKFTSLRK